MTFRIDHNREASAIRTGTTSRRNDENLSPAWRPKFDRPLVNVPSGHCQAVRLAEPE